MWNLSKQLSNFFPTFMFFFVIRTTEMKKKCIKTAHCDKVSIITKYGLSKYQKSIKYHNFLQKKVV